MLTYEVCKHRDGTWHIHAIDGNLDRGSVHSFRLKRDATARAAKLNELAAAGAAVGEAERAYEDAVYSRSTTEAECEILHRAMLEARKRFNRIGNAVYALAQLELDNQ